jgi:hypothetical protein
VNLTVTLFVAVALADHDIDGAGAAMALLGRMKRQHIFQLWQPFGQMALELGDTVGVTLSLAVENNDGSKSIAHAIINEAEYIPTRFFNGHPVQVQARFDRVLPKTELTEYAMLNSGPLPTENIVRCQRLNHIRRQWIAVSVRLIYGGPLTLKVPWGQILWGFNIGFVRLPDTADILHFLQEAQALIFGCHGDIIYGRSCMDFTTRLTHHKGGPSPYPLPGRGWPALRQTS